MRVIMLISSPVLSTMLVIIYISKYILNEAELESSYISIFGQLFTAINLFAKVCLHIEAVKISILSWTIRHIQ